MKKVYLGLFAVALASAGYSQSAIKSDVQPLRKDVSVSTNKTVAPNNQEKGALIQGYDFSTPSNWVASMTSGSSNGWWINTDPAGIPVAALSPFASATAANGYAFINSDSAGNAATQNADITMATPIDLTSYTAVSLEFYHSYRTYQDLRTVQVSNDGGTTWTDFPITDGSESSMNVAETKSINISSVAGGQSSVLVRFHYEGTWGWYWAVDDVAFRVTDPNDLQFGTAIYGSLGSWGATLPYGQVPADQIQPVDLAATVNNIGSADQTNAIVTVNIAGSGDSFTGTSATGFTSVVGASGDTLAVTTQFTPSTTLGTRTIDYAVSSDFTDDNPGDNAGQASFDVTEFVYARDMGTATGGSFNSGNAYEVGNIYDVVTTDTLFSMQVTLSTSTEGTPVIYGKLYSIDATTGDFVYVDQTTEYNVDVVNDPGTELTLPFISRPILTAGEPYLLVVGAYGDAGATNDLVTATAGMSEAQTTFYYDGTDATWYYTTSTPMVRMNFDATTNTVGVEENAKNIGLEQNMPNPANETTLINYSVENTADVNFEVVDMTGKVVYTSFEGTRTPGTYTIKLNTAELANGMYFYSISNGTSKVTKSMSVAK